MKLWPINYNRINTLPVKVGDIIVGNRSKITVQTMTNTKTHDIRNTYNQIIELCSKGAELIRISVPSEKDVKALFEIKQLLIKNDIKIPIIADVHYNPLIAEKCAKFVEKVRINPGNYADISRSQSRILKKNSNNEKENIRKKLKPLIEICKNTGTAIRVGINYASLSWRIIENYGYTPDAMVHSALEFIDIFEDENFYNVVISLKASNVLSTINANKLFAEQQKSRKNIFPIHLGVTEAGLDFEGRIKSILGIGVLLLNGIGDTIRVSLSEHPINEIEVAKNIINAFENIIKNKTICKIFTCTQDNFKNLNLHKKVNKKNLIITLYSSKGQILSNIKNDINIVESESITIVATEFNDYILCEFTMILGYLIYEKKFTSINIISSYDIIDMIIKTTEYILHELGIQKQFSEYISCPTCARATINVEEIMRKIKGATKYYKNLKIAVMGCIVNGPGEMQDADYGCIGSGKNKVTIYSHGNIVAKNININEGVDTLINLIKKENS